MSKDGKQIISIIKSQVPNLPEARLAFAVFERAVIDFLSFSEDDLLFRTAKKYLEGEILSLSLIGIDSDWARDVIFRVTSLNVGDT